jgi:hypothetical protein
MDDWEPTVIRPDQYRPVVLAAIAADAGTTAGAFGPSHGVEVTGCLAKSSGVRRGLWS